MLVPARPAGPGALPPALAAAGHTWRRPRSRSECAQAIVEAAHPHRTLAYALRLLEL
jgi:hypothetical protein